MNNNMEMIFNGQELVEKNKENLVQYFFNHIEDCLEFNINSISSNTKITYDCNIYVVNDDCINIGQVLWSKNLNVCMLNMASYKHIGGGVTRGSVAQEEELCRRSNLYTILKKNNKRNYPLKLDEYIYTTNVCFFKDNQYYHYGSDETKPAYLCDVISIAAIKKSKFNGTDEEYRDIMRTKIQQILSVIVNNNQIDTLLLSAFGCGVYGNDPTFVATLFKEEIQNYKHLYKNIVFAIYNDKNSKSDNYQIFKNIIEG